MKSKEAVLVNIAQVIVSDLNVCCIERGRLAINDACPCIEKMLSVQEK